MDSDPAAVISRATDRTAPASGRRSPTEAFATIAARTASVEASTAAPATVRSSTSFDRAGESTSAAPLADAVPAEAGAEPTGDGETAPFDLRRDGAPPGRSGRPGAGPFDVPAPPVAAIAGGTGTASLAAPVAPPIARVSAVDVAEAIVARSRTLPADGSVDLHLALEPEDLGPVRVQILTRGDRIDVRIVATNGAAIDALGPGLSRLASQLVEAGYRDPGIELALDDRGSGSHGHDREDRSDRSPHDHRSFADRMTDDFLARTAPLAAGRLDRTA
jgi:hypothetical protein